jgi:hypothetical protein
MAEQFSATGTVMRETLPGYALGAGFGGMGFYL